MNRHGFVGEVEFFRLGGHNEPIRKAMAGYANLTYVERERPMKSKERVIVIGGDAAGMTAASVLRRERPETEIVVFERTPHTSFSA